MSIWTQTDGPDSEASSGNSPVVRSVSALDSFFNYWIALAKFDIDSPRAGPVAAQCFGGPFSVPAHRQPASDFIQLSRGMP
ncbi:hypothetical protein SBA1_160013 [Candidatus Sulfotelmatobacter kueseliae]|uniref:Uncharacterized protein n=1 Tax=Candidatus Sulfotelmatobacter kueseliae TaxID=2042962 RepID=A0A2U3KAG9_9BACT|nr:hypothetical protein SBA1_160013 [Candidatus Sulfotelmatobacter kueseliae]